MPQEIKLAGISAKIGGLGVEIKVNNGSQQNPPISRQQATNAIHQINQNVFNNTQLNPQQKSALSANISPHSNEGGETPKNNSNLISHSKNNGNGHQINNLQNKIIRMTLQNNDILLTTTGVEKLVKEFLQTPKSLPTEVRNLLSNLTHKTTQILENSDKLNGETFPKITNELAQKFGDLNQKTKSAILQLTDLKAKTFSQTNIHERLHIAIDLLPKHLSTKDAENILKNSSQEIFDGFLLTYGLIKSHEESSEIRNLGQFLSTISPNEISLKDIRNIGLIVKVLIADAGISPNIADLDLAVQKFVRFLLTNNEFGVLLATINLAREADSSGVLLNRTIAIFKIYELINRLILAGEKVLKEVEFKSLNSFELIKKENNENFSSNKNSHSFVGNYLRQFLEFNPTSKFENSASAFFNPDDSGKVPPEFASLYQHDIEQWLTSGNHRFIKDYVFENPIGIIVERNNENYFSANKLRIILVRDGSVQGWHILKSVLVK